MRMLWVLLSFFIFFNFAFATDTLQVKTKKPWEFWAQSKIGFFTPAYIIGSFSGFEPSFASEVGVKIIKNRHIIGVSTLFNSVKIDFKKLDNRKFTYLYIGTYYGVNLVQKKKFNLSLNAGLLFGRLISASWVYNGTKVEKITGEYEVKHLINDIGNMRIQIFSESIFKLSNKISSSFFVGFITGKQSGPCGTAGNNPSHRTYYNIDCGYGHVLVLLIGLNYKFLEK